MKIPITSSIEEIMNAITHGIGTTLSIIATIFLTIKGKKKKCLSFLTSHLIFGISLIFMYLNSTIYHSINYEPLKKIFRCCDHISIYLLIAGSYSAFTMTILKGKTGTFLTIIEWSIAFFGIISKIFFFEKFEKISLGLYILMGWMVLFFIKNIIINLNRKGLYWLISGGLSYTFGTYFFINDHKILFGHAIWHLFVLFGSYSHFNCIYYYIF